MKKLKETVSYESSTVASSTYDYRNLELIVTFNSGASYQFEGVAPGDYESFRDAESVGKEFSRGIKPYGGKKL